MVEYLPSEKELDISRATHYGDQNSNMFHE
jgi:hypothetical protein